MRVRVPSITLMNKIIFLVSVIVVILLNGCAAEKAIDGKNLKDMAFIVRDNLSQQSYTIDSLQTEIDQFCDSQYTHILNEYETYWNPDEKAWYTESELWLVAANNVNDRDFWIFIYANGKIKESRTVSDFTIVPEP